MVVLFGNNQLALAIERVYIIFVVEQCMVNQLLGHDAHKENDAQKHTDQPDKWFPQDMLPAVVNANVLQLAQEIRRAYYQTSVKT